MNVTYSNSPVDGIIVIYNGSSTPVDCPPESVDPPIGPGANLLKLVETTNETQSGAGAFRREWYVSRVNENTRTTTGPCPDMHPDLYTNPDYVESRLRLDSFYTEQTVKFESLFLVLMGTDMWLKKRADARAEEAAKHAVQAPSAPLASVIHNHAFSPQPLHEEGPERTEPRPEGSERIEPSPAVQAGYGPSPLEGLKWTEPRPEVKAGYDPPSLAELQVLEL
eukprot:gene13566-19437_t